jgi:hypothetical protein
MSIEKVGRPRTPAFAVGTKFKYLTIVGTSTRRDVYGYDVEFYKCQCLCGRVQEKSKSSLRTNPNTQCRVCASIAAAQKRCAEKAAQPPEYHVWRNMMERCNNTQHQAYSNYGGRGITVCKRWHSFDKFYSDMGERPPERSLERINNDRGYSPANCKWATSTEQQRNRRSARYLTANGKTQLMVDWARELGVSSTVIWLRLEKYGWSVQDACTTPSRSQK